MKINPTICNFEEGEEVAYPDEFLNVIFERAETEKKVLEAMNMALFHHLKNPPIYYDVVEVNKSKNEIVLRRSL